MSAKDDQPLEASYKSNNKPNQSKSTQSNTAGPSNTGQHPNIRKSAASKATTRTTIHGSNRAQAETGQQSSPSESNSCPRGNTLLGGTDVSDEVACKIEAASNDLQNGYSQRAQKQWEEILRLLPANATAQLQIAYCQALSGEFQPALKAARLLLAQQRDTPELNHVLVSTLLLCGDPVSAMRAVERAIRSAPNTPELWKQRGLIQFRERNYRECLQSCQKSLSLLKSFDALKLEADAYVALKDFDRAEALYGALIEMNRNDFQLNQRRATLLWCSGKHKEAVDSFQDAAKSVQNLPRFLIAQYQWLSQHGQQARWLLSKISPGNVDDKLVLQQLFELCMQTRQQDQASRWCDELIRREPHNPSGYTQKARLLAHEKDLVGAERVLAQAKVLCGDRIGLEIARINCRRTVLNTTELDAWEQIIKRKLTTGEEYYERAMSLYGLGEERFIKQQASDLAKACELGTAAHYLNQLLMSRFTLARAREDQARGALYSKQLIATTPSAGTFCAVAGMQDHFNQTAEAEASFRHALELDPEWVFADAGLGRLRLYQQKFAEAIPYFKKAVEESAFYDDVRVSLAEAYYLNSQPRAAEQVLKELEKRGTVVSASDLRDRCARFYSNPLQALSAMIASGKKTLEERTKSTSAELDRAAGTGNGTRRVELQRQLSELLFLKGDLHGALSQCDKLIEENKADYDILCRKAAVLYALKDHKEAKRWRKLAVERFLQSKTQ